MWNGSGSITIVQSSENRVWAEVHAKLTSFSKKTARKDCRIEDNAGRSIIKDIDGECHIDDLAGRLHIENIGKGLYVDDGSGMIDISNIGFLKHSSTKVTIIDNSGKIHGESITAQFINIKDHSGNIRLKNTSGHVKVDNNTGRAEITGDKSNLSKSEHE